MYDESILIEKGYVKVGENDDFAAFQNPRNGYDILSKDDGRFVMRRRNLADIYEALLMDASDESAAGDYKYFTNNPYHYNSPEFREWMDNREKQSVV